jgi:methionyl-tRNA synthetase
MAGIFGPDGLRYLLLREVPFDKDGDISPQILVARYNSDLANELGNLFSRTLAMITKYLGGAVPPAPFDSGSELREVLAGAVEGYMEQMDRMQFSKALAAYWTVIQRANRYIEEKSPWETAKDESRRGELEEVFRQLYAVLVTTGSILYPFMPGKMGEMLNQLGVDQPSTPGTLPDLPGAEGLVAPKPLFPRITDDPEDIFKD